MYWWGIQDIHDLLKSDCKIIHEYLIQYYVFNAKKMYKYFNPDLIRNQGLIKNDQKNYCDFPTSVKIFVQTDKNLWKKNP